MNVVKNDDGTVDISFRAGVTFPISTTLTEQATQSSFVIAGRVEFVAYNETNGDRHFTIPATVQGNSAGVVIPAKVTQNRKYEAKYRMTCTRADGFVYDIIKGKLQVYL